MTPARLALRSAQVRQQRARRRQNGGRSTRGKEEPPAGGRRPAILLCVPAFKAVVLAFLGGGSATKPRGRGQSGEAPVPDATRTMLEEVYREILRASHRGAARALTELMGEEFSEPD